MRKTKHKYTIELTRAQFDLPAVADVAYALGLGSISGSGAHEIYGTPEQLQSFGKVLELIGVESGKKSYGHIGLKATNLALDVMVGT